MRDIAIHLEGAVIHDIVNIPEGTVIVVYDYDVEDVEDTRITETPGGPAVVTRWYK